MEKLGVRWRSGGQMDRSLGVRWSIVGVRWRSSDGEVGAEIQNQKWGPDGDYHWGSDGEVGLRWRSGGPDEEVGVRCIEFCMIGSDGEVGEMEKMGVRWRSGGQMEKWGSDGEVGVRWRSGGQMEKWGSDGEVGGVKPQVSPAI